VPVAQQACWRKKVKRHLSKNKRRTLIAYAKATDIARAAAGDGVRAWYGVCFLLLHLRWRLGMRETVPWLWRGDVLALYQAAFRAITYRVACAAVVRWTEGRLKGVAARTSRLVAEIAPTDIGRWRRLCLPTGGEAMRRCLRYGSLKS